MSNRNLAHGFAFVNAPTVPRMRMTSSFLEQVEVAAVSDARFPIPRHIGRNLQDAGKRLLPPGSGVIPYFLASDKATRTFIDSVKRAMQHDVAAGLPADPIAHSVNVANEQLDIASDLSWAKHLVDHRVDLINQEWVSMVTATRSDLLGDPASDKALAAMPALLRQLFSTPELDAAAALLKGTQYSETDKLLMYWVAAALSYGENQGDRNAVYGGKTPSSASGMWATTRAADIDGKKAVGKRVDTRFIARAKQLYDAALPKNARFGFDKVLGGLGTIMDHHDRIKKEWKWEAAKGWSPMRPKDAGVAYRYRTILALPDLGYSWLQTLYHIRNYDDKVLSTAQDKDRMAKDLAFSALCLDGMNLIATVWKSLGASVDKNGLPALKPNAVTPLSMAQRRDLGNAHSAAAVASKKIISSKWNPKRTYYNATMKQWYSRPHKGMDLAVRNKPLLAISDGYITEAGFQPKGFGYWCILYVPEYRASYRYCHLSSYAFDPDNLPVQVLRGEMIGTSGATGNADGPHLHFEYMPDILKDGKYVRGPQVDPLKDPYQGWKYTYI